MPAGQHAGSWLVLVAVASSLGIGDSLHNVHTVTAKLEAAVGQGSPAQAQPPQQLQGRRGNASLELGSRRYWQSFEPTERAITYVACGAPFCDQAMHSLTTLAAQLKLSPRPEHQPTQAYVVVDDECGAMLDQAAFVDKVSPSIQVTPVPVDMLPVPDDMMNVYKTCATARLYLPLVLPVQHMLHLDADTLVTGSVEHVFEMMEGHQAHTVFMAEEVSAHQGGPYQEFYPLLGIIMPGVINPVAGRTGYNSGTLGINVERWKENKMNERLANASRLGNESKVFIHLGDQDLLNFVCRDDLNLLFTLGCRYNVRPNSRCDWAPHPVIIHGDAEVFNRTNNWTGVFEWEGMEGPPIQVVWNTTAEVIVAKAEEVLAAEAETSGDASLWERSGLTEAALPRLRNAEPEDLERDDISAAAKSSRAEAIAAAAEEVKELAAGR